MKKSVDLVALSPPLLKEFKACPNFAIWTLNDYWTHWPSDLREPDRVFQIHVPVALDPSLDFRESLANAKLSFRNQQVTAHVYNQHKYPVIVWPDGTPQHLFRKAFPYPTQLLSQWGGARCFGSTLSYMLAMAVHENYQCIHIHNAPMFLLEEYVYQRRSLENLISLIREKKPSVEIFSDFEAIWALDPIPPDFPDQNYYYHLLSVGELRKLNKEIHEWSQQTEERKQWVEKLHDHHSLIKDLRSKIEQSAKKD